MLKKINIKKYSVILLLITAIILLIGTSYALLRNSEKGTNPYVVNVGLLEISFLDSTNTLEITNSIPISDEEGI